jgi:dTDP-4-amino-4,6-dideoxygalactose transaminase
VIADVDPVTLLLSDDGVAAVRTERTRAVVPVHLYGHVVPFPLLETWRASGLYVIEDAAQAHLATWEGRPVGSVGHAACFSFYPGKNLGAVGDAGMVLSRDEALVAEVRRLRDHGRSDKYRHDVIGWCSRLDGLQAAVLAAKLRHLGAWTEARRHLAARYAELLPPGRLVDWAPGAVHHLLVARVTRGTRDDVAAALRRVGVETGVHYPVPLSAQPALRRWHRPCPTAEVAADEVLSLPMDPLMTEREVDHVVGEVARFVPGLSTTRAAALEPNR